MKLNKRNEIWRNKIIRYGWTLERTTSLYYLGIFFHSRIYFCPFVVNVTIKMIMSEILEVEQMLFEVCDKF